MKNEKPVRLIVLLVYSHVHMQFVACDSLRKTFFLCCRLENSGPLHSVSVDLRPAWKRRKRLERSRVTQIVLFFSSLILDSWWHLLHFYDYPTICDHSAPLIKSLSLSFSHFFRFLEVVISINLSCGGEKCCSLDSFSFKMKLFYPIFLRVL